MVNKYPGTCGACGGRVAKNAGTLHRVGRRWVVKHLACQDAPGVITIRTSGGTFTRNARGTCEDAPCCGCCTF